MAEEKKEHQPVQHTRLTPPTVDECFAEAAKLLRQLEDDDYAIRHEYRSRGLAGEWRRLGCAIRGDVPKESGDFDE